MSFANLNSNLVRLGAASAAVLAPVVAFAQEAAPAAAEAVAAAAPAMTVDKGDTTWMLVSALLVLLMTIPGLGLFYGGLVRAKNMLSVLMQVTTIAATAQRAPPARPLGSLNFAHVALPPHHNPRPGMRVSFRTHFPKQERNGRNSNFCPSCPNPAAGGLPGVAAGWLAGRELIPLAAPRRG